MVKYTAEKLEPYNNQWVEGFLQNVTDLFGEEYQNIILLIVGAATLLILFVLFDFVIKRILLFFTRKIISITKFKWDNHFYDNRAFNSVYHLIPLALTRVLSPYIYYSMPRFLGIVDKFFDIATVLILLQLIIRIANAILSISTDENNYRTIAVRTFGQLMKILTIFFAVIIITSIMFNVDLKTILTSLGAATAILLLIFRDTILGFVSGVQISTSKLVKVGDWITVPKYDLSGTVKEINLVSCKIENFDKTISSIPTYDLISTEIKNFQVMKETNTRRIKRSIVFNVKSFEFCTPQMLEEYKQIDLIKDYIVTRQKVNESFNEQMSSNPTLLANGVRLTNIGVFRKYAESYLRAQPEVSKNDTLMVRQLEITPQGMPLEIYCFATTSVWVDFEKIQSDIFDHLVTASKEFNLEVVQSIPVS